MFFHNNTFALCRNVSGEYAHSDKLLQRFLAFTKLSTGSAARTVVVELTHRQSMYTEPERYLCQILSNMDSLAKQYQDTAITLKIHTLICDSFDAWAPIGWASPIVLELRPDLHQTSWEFVRKLLTF